MHKVSGYSAMYCVNLQCIHFCRWLLECASYSKDGLIWLVTQNISMPTDSTTMLLWVFSWSPSSMCLLLHSPSVGKWSLHHHSKVHIICNIYLYFYYSQHSAVKLHFPATFKISTQTRYIFCMGIKIQHNNASYVLFHESQKLWCPQLN